MQVVLIFPVLPFMTFVTSNKVGFQTCYKFCMKSWRCDLLAHKKIFSCNKIFKAILLYLQVLFSFFSSHGSACNGLLCRVCILPKVP